jgi:tetratricopeptide (TPR) repeat protein
MLITDLEQSHQLNVVSYQRLFDILRLFGREDSDSINIKTATAVAKRARASKILTGSIFKSGDNIRIDYQLQEVKSGRLLSAGKVLGKEPLILADELGADVRAKLDIESATGEVRKIGDVATNSPEAYQHYLEGVNYHEKYDLEKAEECYNKALKYDPTFAMAYFRLALLKEGKDNPEKIKMINKAIKYSDRVSQKDRHYINSFNSVTTGKYNNALAHLKQIVKYYPEEKEAYLGIGVIYSNNLLKPKRSLKYYQRSLDIDPSNDNVYNQLAYVYNQLGDFENALTSVKKCISLKPEEAYSLDTLGDMYAYNGKTNEAIESYKKALEIRTEYQSLRKLGNLRLLKREYSDAENCFKQLCACDNKHYRSEGRACLSLISLYKGQFNPALEILKESEIADKLENYRGRWKALKHLLKSLIFEAKGSLDKAIKEIQENEGIWESIYSVSWPGDYIRFLGKKGDFIKADKIINSFVNKVHDNDIRLQRVVNFNSGCIEFYRGNFKTAIEHLEIASEYLWDMGGPGYFHRKFMLARAHLAAGNYEDAIYLFINLLSLYSVGRAFYSIWSVNMHYYLGIAYEKSGRTDKAIEQYEEFLDIWRDADPGIEEIDDAKARLYKLKQES